MKEHNHSLILAATALINELDSGAPFQEVTEKLINDLRTEVEKAKQKEKEFKDSIYQPPFG